ncbi:uncharacterized protein TNCV_325091 [Trichonephila clavipes]|nr:uncharacterized protein TNCV_325091 [Trichonephila clavipes]
MADFKDLKSVLLYALKVEAANEASCRNSHSVRGARVTTDVPCESPWRKEIEKLREEIQDLMAQQSKKECSNRKGSADENGDVHSKRPCSESSKNLSNSLRVEKKFGVIGPVVRQNNVGSDVEKCCRTCDPCAARKGPRKRTRGRLQLYNVGAPFERIAFDILGPLPKSSDGNNNILVVKDYFTKWPEAYPIPD